jgi:hypothetical protein
MLNDVMAFEHQPTTTLRLVCMLFNNTVLNGLTSIEIKRYIVNLRSEEKAVKSFFDS